ncbi:MAG: DUF1800 domain-containing protein [Actinomycetes bacterium]
MATLTRRRLFGLAAAGAGGLSVAAVAPTGAASAADAGSGADFVSGDLNLHLLRRATFGPTPSLKSAVKKQGRSQWLNNQLSPASIDDSSCERLIRDRFPRVNWSIPQARDELEPFSWNLMNDLSIATIARATWSKRQLFEVMCEFWSNHLNVTNPSDRVWDNRQDYDRRVIRKHALGRFEDMLIGSATHPAMLLYLNNADSTKENPNENYGRELLELHTVSVDGGYSEQDMRNSTLIMTGFGVNWRKGTFNYFGRDHYRGPVSVMGFSHPNPNADGYSMGIKYLKYLANHPSTAHHIAEKLCERFVSDQPDPALVDRLATTYLARGTAIAPVLRQLFNSAEFAGSVGEKTRRPLEDLVATLRVLDVRPDREGRQGMQALVWISDSLGQQPLAWSPPDGYPDVALSWQSAGGTLARWNTHLSLAAHWWPKELRKSPSRDLLPRRLPKTHGAMVDALAKRLVFRTLAPPHKQAILSFLGRSASDPLDSDSEAVRGRLDSVVALILDSPYHWVR